MSKPLECPPSPCSSCPYRLEHPSGVWAEEEYEKLRAFAERPYAGVCVELPCMAVFMCHQSNAAGKDLVCRGWLAVESDSFAVRLALMEGKITPQDAYRECKVPLHPTGDAAADAGLKSIKQPPPEATKMAERLWEKGAAKRR